MAKLVKLVDTFYQKLEKTRQDDNAELLTSSFINYLKSTRYLSLTFSIVILSIILAVLFFPKIERVYLAPDPLYQQQVDFGTVYLQACKSMLMGRLDLIYNVQYLTERGYGLFRYFPLMLFVFTPFVLINNYGVSLILFTIINILLVLYANYLVAKIITKLKLSILPGLAQSLSILFVFFTFESLLQGQIVMIVMAFLLNAMIKLIERHDFQAALLIGIATFFKPVTIVLIAVLLISRIKSVTIIKLMVGITLPLIPDMIFFMLNPSVALQFIDVNSQVLEAGVIESPRCDMTNLIRELTSIPNIYVFIAVMAIGLLLAAKILPKITEPNTRVIFVFVFSAAVYQASQADMWGSQMFLIYPFAAITGALITNKADLSRYRAWFLLYQLPMYGLVLSYYLVWWSSPDVFWIGVCTSSAALVLTAMFIISWLKPTINELIKLQESKMAK